MTNNSTPYTLRKVNVIVYRAKQLNQSHFTKDAIVLEKICDWLMKGHGKQLIF